MDCHPVERCFHMFALGCVDPCVHVRLSEAAFGGLISHLLADVCLGFP